MSQPHSFVTHDYSKFRQSLFDSWEIARWDGNVHSSPGKVNFYELECVEFQNEDNGPSSWYVAETLDKNVRRITILHDPREVVRFYDGRRRILGMKSERALAELLNVVDSIYPKPVAA